MTINRDILMDTLTSVLQDAPAARVVLLQRQMEEYFQSTARRAMLLQQGGFAAAFYDAVTEACETAEIDLQEAAANSAWAHFGLALMLEAAYTQACDDLGIVGCRKVFAAKRAEQFHEEIREKLLD